MINNKQVSNHSTQGAKMRIGLAIVSTFLVHCGGTWAYAFFIILQQGKVSFHEPSKVCLVAELGVAVTLTLVGFFFLGAAIWGMKRKGIEK